MSVKFMTSATKVVAAMTDRFKAAGLDPNEMMYWLESQYELVFRSAQELVEKTVVRSATPEEVVCNCAGLQSLCSMEEVDVNADNVFCSDRTYTLHEVTIQRSMKLPELLSVGRAINRDFVPIHVAQLLALMQEFKALGITFAFDIPKNHPSGLAYRYADGCVTTIQVQNIESFMIPAHTTTYFMSE